MIALSARVQIPETVLFREMEGEAVLLELSQGTYYGLNATGTRMWELLREHGRVEPVFNAFLAEFDVDETRLLQELTAFVSTLASRGLLTIHAA
jgi:hypothetical protein